MHHKEIEITEKIISSDLQKVYIDGFFVYLLNVRKNPVGITKNVAQT